MRSVFHFDERRLPAAPDEIDEPAVGLAIVEPAQPRTLAEMVKQDRLQTRAERELRWFFLDLLGRVPEPGAGPEQDRVAAQTIDRWLRSIPPFHRGALALSYEKRSWPEALSKEFGSLTSLIVRLECAHLANGQSQPGAIEEVAILHLEQAIEACRRRRSRVQGCHRHDSVLVAHERSLGRRRVRARQHVRLAVKAYMGARGQAPCVLPRASSTDAEGT
jgi:hypothetical protein